VVIFLNHYGNDPQLVVWTGRQLEEMHQPRSAHCTDHQHSLRVLQSIFSLAQVCTSSNGGCIKPRSIHCTDHQHGLRVLQSTFSLALLV